MCGIAGIVSTDVTLSAAARERATEKMTAALRHRGPDGTGFHHSPHASLGHARLSIIDLENGAQPLYSEDGKTVLVCNGEIYDFRSLRKGLENKYRFTTQSDSEVALHLFREEGTEFVDRLNGMYAIALLEIDENQLTLCIDDRGIKPLYFTSHDSTLAFASELRALIVGMKALGMPIEADYASLRSYLHLGWVPAPGSAIKGVQKLNPGEMIQWVAGTHRQIRGESKLPAPPASESEPIAHLEDALRTAVSRQLIADVPVGFFLSGGIDSSLLTAIAAGEHDDVRTFNVRFEGGTEASRVDESQKARTVAKVLGTEHHEFIVNEDVLRDSLFSTLSELDEPIADVACLPLYLISRLARKEVKVCISGDGGDELFGGYTRHRLWPYKSGLSRSTLLTSIANGIVGVLPKRRRPGRLDLLRKSGTAIDLLLDPNYVKGPFSGRFSGYVSSANDTVIPNVEVTPDELQQLQIELNQPLAGQLLAKTDRMSMLAGLEVRVPFLDKSVVAASQLFSIRDKATLTESKIPLRRLLARYLPDDLVQQPKRGFRVPVSSWFRGELANELKSSLLDDNAIPATIIRPDALEKLVLLHTSGSEEHSIRLWSALVLHSWFQSVERWQSG